METKLNYTLIGLFVIVLGGALLSTLLWLTVGTENKQYSRYIVYSAESVAGLNPKASVKYKGVEVGNVASIELDPENPELVKISLDIEHGAPIRQNTIAKLTIQGLTGLASVELTGGSRDSPPLVPHRGEPPPVIPSGPSLLAQLNTAFDEVLTNFYGLSEKLGRLLNETNQAALTQTLAHLNTLTGALANRAASIDQTLANLQTISTAFASRSETVGQALDEAARTLQQTARLGSELTPTVARINTSFTALEEMARSVTTTARRLDTVVQGSGRDLQRLANNTVPQLNLALGDLRRLLQTLDRLAQELERDPRSLVFGRQPPAPGPGE